MHPEMGPWTDPGQRERAAGYVVFEGGARLDEV